LNLKVKKALKTKKTKKTLHAHTRETRSDPFGDRPNGLALAPRLPAFGMAGSWKSWLLQKKAGFLASFEMFSALRAGLAGEVRVESDFEARAAVFLQRV
jgi:hypothetical protein